MPRINDKQLAIATVYAQAMIELAESQGATDALMAELDELGLAIERDPELADFLASPLIDSDERRDSLEKIFRGRASDLFVDSLQVVNRKGRLALIEAITVAFAQARRELRNEVDVDVTSAVPLSAALRARLQQAVDHFTGKKSRLLESVEPKLLGGMVLRVGDQKIDSSVARELEMMKEALAARTSREILAARHTRAESQATA
jgi:F-type H+-transporting ATPase subunit delta